MFRTLRDIARLIHAARVLARYDALIPREYASRLPMSMRCARLAFGGLRAQSGSTPAGERLARALEGLGPAYIKLGQALATRPDIIGDEVAQALECLQDRLPPFETDVARAEVASDFARPLEMLFATFSEPIAAASIAQVHPAETKEEAPRRVAVKILRPNIEMVFARDLSAFALAARIAERLWPEARRLRAKAVVDTFAHSVAIELDLRMEAAAASELAELMGADEHFRVPAVDWQRTSSHVLTTEWVDGVALREPAAIEAAGHDPKRVAVLLIRAFLTQALRDGFFHADMHPGNLFIDAQGRLVAVDFGIMGRLDPAMRRFMAETLAGFLERDYRRVANVHYDAGFVPRNHPPELFAQALRAIGEPVFGRTVRDVSMARLLQQLFDTTKRFDMELQPQLVLLQKTMVVVEGVARTLDPEFDIWEASRPVVERWMLEHVGPQAQLRDAAESMTALRKLAHDLPQLLRDAEAVSAMLAAGGVRLHPETVRELANAQLVQTRHARLAFWVTAAGVLAMLAARLL